MTPRAVAFGSIAGQTENETMVEFFHWLRSPHGTRVADQSERWSANARQTALMCFEAFVEERDGGRVSLDAASIIALRHRVEKKAAA